jgi:hypothetical protein
MFLNPPMKSPWSLALVIAAALAFGSSACMVGDDPVDESSEPAEDDLPPPLSEASLSNNGRTAFNYFVNKGLTEIQAAGIVGNLMQESGVNPTAVQPGGPGRGIAQWSIGARWSNLQAYANNRGLNRWSLNTQLDFTWYELTTVSSYGLASLRTATTITSAVTVFQNKFEICGTCAQTMRIAYAQQALANYGGGGSGTGTGGTGGSSSDDSCFSGTLGRDVPERTCVQSVYDGDWYECENGRWVDRWSDPYACSGEYPL